jgi:plastocyanin
VVSILGEDEVNLQQMRLCGLLWFHLFLACFPISLFGSAVVEGKVALPASHGPSAVVVRRYRIVTNGGTLATQPPLAVVYLQGSFPGRKHPATRQMAQKNLAFLPPLLPIEVGTQVKFPNFDYTYHSVFSYSPTKRFDLGRYRSDERPIPSETFDKPGLVVLRCDIHEHMRGLILVLDTPYFVITNAKGRFRLSGLPAGHFVLKAWIDSRTTREHPVELKNGETLHVDFL